MSFIVVSDKTKDPRTENRKLPTGVAEFDQLLIDLKTEYGAELPTVDDESLKFVLASSIMHLGPTEAHKPLEFFYETIVAGAAKQVAHHVFRDTKLKQEAKAKAEEAAKQQEATNLALPEVASDDSQF